MRKIKKNEGVGRNYGGVGRSSPLS